MLTTDRASSTLTIAPSSSATAAGAADISVERHWFSC